MKQIKIALALLISIANLSANTTSQSNEKETSGAYVLVRSVDSCERVLKDCDDAVTALEAQVGAANGVISAQGTLIETQRAEIERVRRKYDARISPVVWVIGGVLVGAAGALYLTK